MHTAAFRAGHEYYLVTPGRSIVHKSRCADRVELIIPGKERLQPTARFEPASFPSPHKRLTKHMHGDVQEQDYIELSTDQLQPLKFRGT